jgi:hypothetical protein
MEPPSEISGTTWGALTPTSFQTTLYVPCLKISITAGSFIRLSKGESAPQVGRIIDVVSSIDSVPQPENHPLIQTPLPDNFDVGIQLQFAKVNLFIDRLLLSDREFPAETSSSCDGWQGIVQLDGYEWIPSHLIIGLSFVFMEEDMLSHSFDDCRGMSIFLFSSIAKQELEICLSYHDTNVHRFLHVLSNFRSSGPCAIASLFSIAFGRFDKICNVYFVVSLNRKVTLL